MSQIPQPQIGFAQTHVRQCPTLETGETPAEFKTRVLSLARTITDYGLFVENGELQYHKNIDRVQREIESLSVNDRDVMHHSNDTTITLISSLVDHWQFGLVPEKHQNPETVKVTALSRIKSTLGALQSAGFGCMPMASDACGRRIGDGSSFTL
jgi:hypothetical protein